MVQTNMVPGRVTCPRHGREIDIGQTETAPYDATFFWWYCPACRDWHPTPGCLTNPSESVKDRANGGSNGEADPLAMPPVLSGRSG